MRIAELCAGYGGLGLAVQAVLGGEVVLVADNDPDASRVLAHRFPAVPNLGDISTADWEAVAGRIDVLCAGFPCFPAGTLIDAGEDGLRAIETLRVGDLVLTHNRRRRAVASVMRRDADDVLLLKAMGAPAFRVTAEHPFYVRRLISGRERSWSAPEWIEAGQLDKSCFLAMPLDDPGDDPVLGVELAYVVGRWLGDGWIIDHPRRGRADSWMRKAIICCAVDEDAELAAAVRAAGLHATRSPDRTVTKFHITSADLVKMLRPFGRGAGGKQIPGWVFTAPLAEQEAMLRGWFDADGSQQASGQWRATTISERLAHGMARIARTVYGVATSVHRFDVPPRTVIEGRDVRQNSQFQVALPPRNRESFIADGYAWVPVRSVSPAEACEVFNVSVDEDESYVAYGFAVHNCQDISSAGQRAGLRAGTRSGVWQHVARAVGASRPPLVLIENVASSGGLLSAWADSDVEQCPWCLGTAGTEHALRAAGAVLGDLATLGYDAQWAVVSAAEAGAPHRRERIFILAWPAADAAGDGWDEGRPEPAGIIGGSDAAQRGHGPAADAAGDPGLDGGPGMAWGAYEPAIRRWEHSTGRPAPRPTEPGRTAERLNADDTEGRSGQALRDMRRADGAQAVQRSARGPDAIPGPEELLTVMREHQDGDSAELASVARPASQAAGGVRGLRSNGGPACPPRRPRRDEQRSGEPPDALRQLPSETALAGGPGEADGLIEVAWGPYEPAIRRWEQILGRAAPPPTEKGRTGQRLSPRFVEFMMGLPEGWVTGVPGLSRSAQLRVLGNGVVPQQCALALAVLLSAWAEANRESLALALPVG